MVLMIKFDAKLLKYCAIFFLLCIYSIIAANNSGVAFDIAGSTINRATQLQSLGNDSLCNSAPTRYILYRTHTLFRDLNLGTNVSIGTEIISALVGSEHLADLQEPSNMSFDLLDDTRAVSEP